MIKNFLFHRVNPQRDVLWDPMDVALFEKCIRFIKDTYNVVQVEHFKDLDLNSKQSNYATITFDDGYKDNLEYAAPILKKYNCKASFYVVTDCIDQNIPTWTHELKHRFMFTQRQYINLDFDFLPSQFRVTKLLNPKDRINYVKKLKPLLLHTTFEQKSQLLEEVRHSFNDVELPQIMMNWDDLKQLQSEGHMIGSHSVSHMMLGTTENEPLIRHELSRSFQTIKDRLGKTPKAVAYPVGSYNERVKTLAQEVGYTFGLAVTQSIYKPNIHDFFEIPRLELYNESWIKTRLRMNNSLEWLKSAIGYR